jgi:hypothetical protein
MTASESLEGAGPATTPVHLWVIGVLALLWNLMGAFDYLATQLKLDFYMSQFSQEQLDYFYGYPAWATAGWALAVWGALAGSVGLLLRKRWALWAFVVSFAGMLVSMLYSYVLSNGMELMGGPGILIFSMVIFVVAVFLVVYCHLMAKRGVLT